MKPGKLVWVPLFVVAHVVYTATRKTREVVGGAIALYNYLADDGDR